MLILLLCVRVYVIFCFWSGVRSFCHRTIVDDEKSALISQSHTNERERTHTLARVDRYNVFLSRDNVTFCCNLVRNKLMCRIMRVRFLTSHAIWPSSMRHRKDTSPTKRTHKHKYTAHSGAPVAQGKKIIMHSNASR